MRKLTAGIILLSVLLAGCSRENNADWETSEEQHRIFTEGESSVEMTAKPGTEGDETVSTPDVSAKSETITESLEEPDINAYVKVRDYIPDIVIDLKYATKDNFTGQVIYDFKEAYLHYGTVLKLKKVQEQLKAQGYGLKIWDAYRPFYAQERLWEVYPNPAYVADPAKGRRGHNLGNTVDITLVYADGTEVPMPTGFDDFSTRADRDYSEIEEDLAANALLLQETMYANGFTGYKGEWWDFTDTDNYTDTEEFVPQE